MTQELKYKRETASQTAGPYVHIGLAPAAAGLNVEGEQFGEVIAGPNAKGRRIVIEGTIWDGAGAPVKDAVIEAWQADAEGVYHQQPDPVKGFRGWGRCVPSFDTGIYRFETIKPGCVKLPDGNAMAPHLCLWVVARGINTGLHTRLYFDDETERNASDPVLNLIEQNSRRETLIARSTQTGYTFDIVLQGSKETVFFDV